MRLYVLAVLAAFTFLDRSALAAAVPPPVGTSTESVTVSGGTIEVTCTFAEVPLPKERVLRWVRDSARAVAAYYGRFPVERARISILTGGRGGVSGGFTAYRDPFVRIRLGPATTEAELADDWELTHEMVHLASPCLDRKYSWLAEGIATWVEPIARVRVGTLSEDDLWHWTLVGIPKGLPEKGDLGLDRTHTWGRTYWGGALFCLLADLQIREKSGGKMSLEDALRGVLRAGGNVLVEWDIERVLREGDKATGLDVLTSLHAKMGSSAYPVDVDALFQKLGVDLVDGRVVYDDKAPLAAVRKAIAAGKEPRPTSGTASTR